jgi:stage II sporulation protein GA (sporulation sigma-E factor processing peptidase)
MPLVLSVIYKLVVGVVISFSAFLPKNRKLLFKTTLAFFFVNFIFGGVMYFVEITFNVSNIIYMNGTVYFDISILFLVSMTLICYGLLLIGDYFLKRRASENTLYDVELRYRNKSVFLKALYDTGNHLTDGLIGKPVVVVELNSITSFFTVEELRYLKEDFSSAEIPKTLMKEIRVIPCGSVTGETVLKGFSPEKILIRNEDVVFETEYLIVATVNKKISDGEYNCILNSAIFERGNRVDTKVNK